MNDISTDFYVFTIIVLFIGLIWMFWIAKYWQNQFKLVQSMIVDYKELRAAHEQRLELQQKTLDTRAEHIRMLQEHRDLLKTKVRELEELCRDHGINI